MPSIQCSAMLLTLNAGKTLERCLSSIQEFSEIIILDGNSTDNTVEISTRYGAKVYPQKETLEKNVRIEDFTEMRKKLVAHTTLPWVFDLDADEYVSPELLEEIRQVVSNPQADITRAYNVKRLAVIDEHIIHHAYLYPDLYVRLYNKQSGIVFRDGKVVHEQLYIPPAVTVALLHGPVYAPWPPLGEYLRDNYYLSLVEQKKSRTDFVGRVKILKSGCINIVKAIYIFFKITKTHLRYGFANDVMPFAYSWRFVRYHLLLAALRFRQSVTL